VQSEVDAVRELYARATAEGHAQAAYHLALMHCTYSLVLLLPAIDLLSESNRIASEYYHHITSHHIIQYPNLLLLRRRRRLSLTRFSISSLISHLSSLISDTIHRLTHADLGKGVPKDLKRAVHLLHVAAIRGHKEATVLMSHSEAQYNLALLYLQGSSLDGGGAGAGAGGGGEEFGEFLAATCSVPKDVRRAVEYLERAADQGHARATYRLGRLLFGGDADSGGVVARDHKRALDLLQKAGDLGCADAAL
jgi:TPR repeat protein